MAKATVRYSEESHSLHLTVPRGTKWTDVGKIVELCTTTVFQPPRICNTCLSGRVLQIIEDAPEVTEVNLDK